MADNDPVEFSLYNNDLITKVAILPYTQGKLYLELQEIGSGDVTIHADSASASLVTSGTGMFIGVAYRGAYRGGFFVDNVHIVEADEKEDAGRLLSISGRGLMSVLEDFIVWEDGTGSSVRTFENMAKGEILAQLIDEAIDRGAAILDLDFGPTNASDGPAYSDNESYNLNVGMSLLEVMRLFAKSGDYEFGVTLQNTIHPVLISAYVNGIGTDKSSSIYFRIGSNCQEVSSDERSTDIKNVLLTKFKNGYITVSDSTSITARRRREDFLNIEAAQSGDSASTYAAAQLENKKNPVKSIAVLLTDAVNPNVFIDYILGDTIMLDKFGVNASYRVLGIHIDFRERYPADVIIELNNIIYENDLKMSSDIDWLLSQWNTAKDANLFETKKWMSIGEPNGEIYALHHYGDYLYIGGDFTSIGGLSASYIVRYNIITGALSSMNTGGTITGKVKSICDVSGNIWIITDTKIYEWDGVSSWTLRGTASGGGSPELLSLYSDGTDLYVTGSYFNLINAVSITTKIAKWNGSVWSSVGAASPSTAVVTCFDVQHFGGVLYAATDVGLGKFVAGSWSLVFSALPNSCNALAVASDNLVFYLQNTGGGTYDTVRIWDGVVAASTVIGTVQGGGGINGFTTHIKTNLSDIYVTNIYTFLGDATPQHALTRYSGGSWSILGGGVDSSTSYEVRSIEIINDDIYVGGLFEQAGEEYIDNLAVFVTSFENLISHLEHDNNQVEFDMGAAIHAASASAITNSDEIPFWEDVSNALRKITWANIKSALLASGSFGYYDKDFWASDVANATSKNPPVDADNFSISDGVTSLMKRVTWLNIKATLKTYFDTLYTYYTNTTLAADLNGASSGTPVDAELIPYINVGSALRNVTVAILKFVFGDGWVPQPEVWTRTGNYTFTVPNDRTIYYRKGTKIRCKQGGGYIYGVIQSSSFAASTTTVTLITNSDFTLTATTITNNGLSYIAIPEGFPEGFTFGQSYTGFSANPTQTVKWSTVHNRLFLSIATTANGTSNATTFTMSLPATVAQGTIQFANVTDNGTEKNGIAYAAPSTTTLTYYAGVFGAAFVNSGTKGGSTALSYLF